MGVGSDCTGLDKEGSRSPQLVWRLIHSASGWRGEYNDDACCLALEK